MSVRQRFCRCGTVGVHRHREDGNGRGWRRGTNDQRVCFANINAAAGRSGQSIDFRVDRGRVFVDISVGKVRSANESDGGQLNSIGHNVGRFAPVSIKNVFCRIESHKSIARDDAFQRDVTAGRLQRDVVPSGACVSDLRVFVHRDRSRRHNNVTGGEDGRSGRGIANQSGRPGRVDSNIAAGTGDVVCQ